MFARKEDNILIYVVSKLRDVCPRRQTKQELEREIAVVHFALLNSDVKTAIARISRAKRSRAIDLALSIRQSKYAFRAGEGESMNICAGG